MLLSGEFDHLALQAPYSSVAAVNRSRLSGQRLRSYITDECEAGRPEKTLTSDIQHRSIQTQPVTAEVELQRCFTQPLPV